MTDVKVTGRFINVLPIQELFNQFDSLVDDICFIVDDYVDGDSFADWTWRLYWKTPLNDGYTVLLESGYDQEHHKALVYWKPAADVLDSSGYLTIQLRAVKETEQGLRKWNTAITQIHVGRSLQALDRNIRNSFTEDYMDLMEQVYRSGLLDYVSIQRSVQEEVLRAQQRENELQAEINRLKALIPGGNDGTSA